MQISMTMKLLNIMTDNFGRQTVVNKIMDFPHNGNGKLKST